MRVHIDENRCQGHGRCYALASGAIEPDDLGNGRTIGDGSVAPDQEPALRMAVENRPEQAVSITAGPGGRPDGTAGPGGRTQKQEER